MLKTVFFGTPSVAAPFLEQLNALTEIVLVVTQPDRPAGRGLVLTPCPVKKRALELGLKVISPEVFKDSVPQIAALGADFGLAVAYGKIFRKPALQAFKHGIINIHFSLLPEYRGAAPVQQALFDGRAKTGITAFWIDEGLDTGPVALQKEVPIAPQDDALTLFPKLTEAGKEAVRIITADIAKGKITAAPQQGEPCFAPMIDKKDTFLDFRTMSAERINNTIRALAAGMPAIAKAQNPQGEIIQILKAGIKPLKAPQQTAQAAPGSLIAIERGAGFFVQCYKDVLFIERLRPAGKKDMSAWDYINGKQKAAGDIIFL